jgi:acetyl esterase/lipase
MSWQLWALDAWLRLREKPRLAREPSVEVARAHMEATAARAFPVEPGVWQEARLRADPPLAAWRLPAPEAAFPAAVEDALAAWEALRAEGWPAGRIALGGDSAGGGLAFALLHLLLAAGAPPPGCVVAFSPWTDLTLRGASLSRLARRDAFLPVARMGEIRDLYLAGADPRDPRASPPLGRFAGAPPVLIQASRAEILLDDARLMAGRLEVDGAAVTLDLVPGAPHVWQAYHGWLPEAAAALGRAADFVARHLTSA